MAHHVRPELTVGRHHELDALDGLLAGLVSGSAGILVLRGEAGIGKSHLCRVAVTRAANSGVRTAMGFGDELEQDRPGRLLLAIEDVLLRGGALASPEHHGSDDGDPGYRVMERFLTAVDRAASAGPLLVVAEDLHWADDLSLRGLASLIRGITRMPCALVITERNHPRPRRLADLDAHISDVASTVHCRTIELGGLVKAEIEEMASAQIRAAPGPRLRTMLAGAAGNPFMVDALLRAVHREGLVDVGGGVAELRAGEVPLSVYEALTHRLRSLPTETVEVLRHASLLGRSFTPGEVAVITGAPVVEVVRVLEDAVDAGMVVSGDDHHEFRHDLVRGAVYRSISSAGRWDLHRAAGAALARAGAPALRVAQQLIAGARPGDVEAVEWLQRAANEALALDTGAAAELLQRAVSLAPADWSGRFDLEADLVGLLGWAGRIEDALGRARSLVDRSIGDSQRLRAHKALGAVLSSSGDLRRAADNFLAASAAAEAHTSAADVLRCAAAGMSIIAGTLSPAEARAVATPAVGSDQSEVVCWARNTLAVAAVAEGAYDEVIEHARVAASILDDRYVEPLGFLIPHTWLMTGLQYLDRYDEARQAGERARERAERRGDVGLLVQVMAATCGITWAEGVWDDTLAETDAALALMDDTGAAAQTILFHAVAAQIAMERGRQDDAMSHLAAAETFAASGIQHLFGFDVLAAVQARVAAQRDPDAARDLLAGVWDITAALRGLVQWRLIGPQLIGLCLATGRDEQAAAIVEEIRVLAGRSSAPSASATATRAEGLLRRDPGLLLDAADALLGTPRRIEAAAACEEAVGLLTDTNGARSGIERLLDAAGEIYVSADATAAVSRLGELRRRAGLEERGAPVVRARFGWEALTPKELEVVRLVARGMSNPDIAAALFISRRTVEAHLSHVFQKVAVSNRTELARSAIDRGLA